MNDKLWYNVCGKIDWDNDTAVLLKLDIIYGLRKFWVPKTEFKQIDNKLFITKKIKQKNGVKLRISA